MLLAFKFRHHFPIRIEIRDDDPVSVAWATASAISWAKPGACLESVDRMEGHCNAGIKPGEIEVARYSEWVKES